MMRGWPSTHQHIHLFGGWIDLGDHEGDRRLNYGCSVGVIVGV